MKPFISNRYEYARRETSHELGFEMDRRMSVAGWTRVWADLTPEGSLIVYRRTRRWYVLRHKCGSYYAANLKTGGWKYVDRNHADLFPSLGDAKRASFHSWVDWEMQEVQRVGVKEERT